MKKIFLLTVACLFYFTTAFGQLYLGIGPSYFMPAGPLYQSSDEQLGFNIQLENRYYCNLWWGVRVEYYDFAKKPELFDTPYLQDYLSIAPNIKINLTETSLIGNNSCNGKIIPYLNLGLIAGISSTNQPQTDKFGLGASAGLGIHYGFTVARLCASFELYSSFNSSNLLYRDEARSEINGLILGITLSVRL